MQRRDFLKRMSGTAVAAGFPVISRTRSPNETIRIGCIGTGGRCRMLMREVPSLSNARITYVCDIWDHHLAEGKKLAEAQAGVTQSYEEVLESQDVDAVIIGTPDHWHVPMTVAACQAGKHAYVEKPLTHALEEGAQVLAACKGSDTRVQIGTQQRSMPQFKEAAAIIRSGEIGPVHKVHLTWNRNQSRDQRRQLGIDPSAVLWNQFLGPAPDQPFDQYRFRRWRWFWDFGGGILTDLLTHHMDIANWFLDLKEPASATTIGDHFMAEGFWETPDTIQTFLSYPDRQVQVYFEGTFVNARNGAMLEFMGTEATLYLDRGRLEIHPEKGSSVNRRETILGEGPRGADFYREPNGERLHLANWMDSIRLGTPLNAPVEAGVLAVVGPHMGNLAYRENRVVERKEI